MEKVKKEVVVEPVVETVVEIDPITLKDEEIAKLKAERDNYKNVALKRLGKLPADNEFLGDENKDVDSLIEEKVKMALLDKEINRAQLEKENEIKRITRENSELKLALKNRPGNSIGGDSGTGGVEVKDNVFSKEQLAELEKRAIRLKVDPQKFIENFKKNLLK